MECVFCKIANGEIPSYTIYEDALVKVLLDINPDCNGHTLIIPKNHYNDIDDIDDDILKYIIKVTREIKKLLENKLKIDGLTLIQNNGVAQEIKHFHIHLKPHYINKENLKDVEEIFKKLNS